MSGEKILIVDDEEDMLELVAYNLTREGFRTVNAASGEEALKKARSEMPDLIVLDVFAGARTPGNLTSVEAFGQALRALTPGGSSRTSALTVWLGSPGRVIYPWMRV